MKILLTLTTLLLLTACATPPSPTPTPPPPTVASTTAPAPTQPPNNPTTQPPSNQTTQPTTNPTPLPALLEATLPRLAQHNFIGTNLTETGVITTTDTYTTSAVTYFSDGIKISGLLNVPKTQGKHPAVVLIHGYVTPDQYTQGLEAQPAALELTQNGYITLVPDLRGYADSDNGSNLFISGWIADAINAGNALKQLPNIDAENVGLWGHSMGGGIATRAIVVSDTYDAVVLYAPISANIDDMFMDPFGGSESGITETLVQNLIAALDDTAFRASLSPINYLDRVTAPVSIHVGADDTVTPPQWSQAIRDALQKAGKTVEYFEYPDGGHSLQDENLKQFRERVLTFFDNNLK